MGHGVVVNTLVPCYRITAFSSVSSCSINRVHIMLKIVNKFPSDVVYSSSNECWRVCIKTIPFAQRVNSHYLVTFERKKLGQNSVISRNFKNSRSKIKQLLSAWNNLLNWHYRYNIHNTQDCLLSGRCQTMSSCMSNSAVASASDCVLKQVVNTSNINGNNVNKWCA